MVAAAEFQTSHPKTWGTKWFAAEVEIPDESVSWRAVQWVVQASQFCVYG